MNLLKETEERKIKRVIIPQSVVGWCLLKEMN